MGLRVLLHNVLSALRSTQMTSSTLLQLTELSVFPEVTTGTKTQNCPSVTGTLRSFLTATEQALLKEKTRLCHAFQE